MPFFKQEILVESEDKGGLDSKEYLDSLENTTGFRKTILDIMMSDNKSGRTVGIYEWSCLLYRSGEWRL